MGTTLFRMGLDRENGTDLRCRSRTVSNVARSLAYKPQFALRHSNFEELVVQSITNREYAVSGSAAQSLQGPAPLIPCIIPP